MAISLLQHFSLFRRFLLPAACLLLGAVQAHAGLIAHYTFNETSGTTAADSSGNGNTGTLTNMTGSEWTTGKVGGGLTFDGTNDYVGLGNVHNNLGDATVSAWVYVQGGSGTWRSILMKNKILGFELNSGNGITLFFGNGSAWGSGVNSASTVSMNQWVHVAGTRPGSTVTMYIDGVSDGTGSNSATGSNSLSLGIGARQLVSSANGHLPGIIDDVRLYNTALSASDVSALAAMGGNGDGAGAPEPAETFAFLGLLTAAGLGFREWRSRRKAKTA
jgi:hypothetical protein